jgi:hypothetical protein
LATINQTAGQSRGQLQLPISCFQQQRATITTAMRLVELEMYWLAGLFRKDQTLCYFLHAHLQSPSAVGFFAKATLQQARNYR